MAILIRKAQNGLKGEYYTPEQASMDTTKVSSNYSKSFPQLQTFIGNDTKLGQNRFNRTDSAALTPFLNKLNSYVEYRGGVSNLTENEKYNTGFVTNQLGRPHTRAEIEYPLKAKPSIKLHKPVHREGVIKGILEEDTFKDIQEATTDLPKEEMEGLMKSNLRGMKDLPILQQIKSAIDLKPKSISVIKALKYYNYLTGSPVSPMISRSERDMTLQK